MRTAIVFLSGLFALGAASADESRSAFRFAFENDHTNLIYRCGETARFSVRALAEDGSAPTCGVFRVRVDNFGKLKLRELTWNLAASNVLEVAETLAEPGFLRMCLVRQDAKESEVNWSVGFEPTRIVKGSPKPVDFDAFWSKARAKLAAEVQLDPEVVLVDDGENARTELYRISFATFGRRVYGWLSVPKDRSKGPFPVEFSVNAAGFGSWTNLPLRKDNRICVKMSVYPFPMEIDFAGCRSKYLALNAELHEKYKTLNYTTAGIGVSREEYFFYPVILGIDRVVDWVAARGDVDPARFVYTGTSQGGGFGFYLTGLNRHFTRAVFFVPAMTDTMGYLKGRQSGYPSIVENNSSTPEIRRRAEMFAPYFDAANFASRIECPVRIGCGFADTCCAPCAVYAAYNEIDVPDKGIVNGFGMTHTCFPGVYADLDKWAFSEPSRQIEVRVRQTPGGPRLFVDGKRHQPWSVKLSVGGSVPRRFSDMWTQHEIPFVAKQRQDRGMFLFRFERKNSYGVSLPDGWVRIRNFTVVDEEEKVVFPLNTFADEKSFKANWWVPRGTGHLGGAVLESNGVMRVDVLNARPKNAEFSNTTRNTDFYVSTTWQNFKVRPGGRYRVRFEAVADHPQEFYPTAYQMPGFRSAALEPDPFTETIRLAKGGGRRHRHHHVGYGRMLVARGRPLVQEHRPGVRPGDRGESGRADHLAHRRAADGLDVRPASRLADKVLRRTDAGRR